MGVPTSDLVLPTGTLTADDSVQSGFDWKYANDLLERLIDAQAGTLSGGNITNQTRKQAFDLDHVGARTHTDLITGVSTTVFDWDFTHIKVNEITGWNDQVNNVTPVYDAAGDLADDKRNWKYEYDAWYRLVKVRDQSDNVKAEFAWNALGYRISARYDQTAPWMHFAYDERWRIVAMYEDNAAASAPTEQFWSHNAGLSGLGGSSYIDDVVLRDRDTDASGTLDERRYYLQNQHHDVVALTNTSGSIVERVNYDPYGSPIGTFTSIANRKGYAGYEYDGELGNTYHVRHRVYRSELGVWVRRDPADGGTLASRNSAPLPAASEQCDRAVSLALTIIRQLEVASNQDLALRSAGYNDGLNLYAYCLDRPLRSTDPMGMDCPGCDTGHTKPCQLRCCALHDACYHKHKCRAPGLGNLCRSFRCCWCDLSVVGCFAHCAIDPGHNPRTPMCFCQKRGVFYDPPWKDPKRAPDPKNPCRWGPSDQACCCVQGVDCP